MNGATAEPWASTIKAPSTAIIRKIGHSQNFLRIVGSAPVNEAWTATAAPS